MENPNLTFVTPTLLAGDRSLVDVVAHEIAHSWMGNLVTTGNWASHVFSFLVLFTYYMFQYLIGILNFYLQYWLCLKYRNIFGSMKGLPFSLKEKFWARI